MIISHRSLVAALTAAWLPTPAPTSGRPGRDRGSAAVEIVLLAPVLVVGLLFVVLAGRAGGAVEEVRHAADQGARAASAVRAGAMEATARAAVVRDLDDATLDCAEVTVSVVRLSGASDAVSVTVTCAISIDGTELLRAVSRTVSATSTEVVDRYRAP